MARVQIVARRTGERWRFIAHGAAYTADEAAQWRATLEGKGERVRFLPLGRDTL